VIREHLRLAALFVSGIYSRASATKIYDWLFRLVTAGWYGWAAWYQFLGILFVLAHPERDRLALETAARASGLLFLISFACLVLLRHVPLRRSPGVMPRLVALGGTLSLGLVTFLPRADLAAFLQAASIVMVLGGWGLGIYVLSHLGRALSIMPEARRLVTTGPYAVIRHPLYVAEAIGLFGLTLQFLSWPALLLFAVQCGFQFLRMFNEERVLTAAFPAYEDYARRTARLIPGVY